MRDFKKLFGKSDDNMPVVVDDEASPAGLNEKPDGGAGAAKLSRKPVVVGALALGAVLFIGYTGLKSLHHTTAVSSGNVSPASASDADLPAPPKDIPQINIPASNSGGQAVNNVNPPKPSSPLNPSQPTQADNNNQPNAAEQAAEQANRQILQQEQQERTQAMTASFQGAASASTSWQNSDNKNSGGQSSGAKPAAALMTASVNYNSKLVTNPASPYEILQGSVIPATLTTAIQSDLPGQITAIVSRNVYDSESGNYMLVPAGARLVGYYSDKIIAGQTRVGVDWTRLIFPNGSSITLDAMPGTDGSGQAGLHDEVNFHTWEIFRNALMMSAIQVGVAMSQPGYGNSNGENGNNESASQLAESQMATTFGQTEAQIMQKYINIAPTLNIRSGYQLNVEVTRDIVFPGPYLNQEAAPATTPSQPIASPVQNPY